MSDKISMPKGNCPTCVEIFDTECIVSKVSHPKLGLTSGQKLSRILSKIGKKISYLTKRVNKDYKITKVDTGEKWLAGETVYRIVVEIENTTTSLIPITVNLTSIGISEILEMNYVNTTNNINNVRSITYDKTTFDLISDVEANTKNYIIIKYV